MWLSFHGGTDTDGSRSMRSMPVSPWIIPMIIAAIVLVMAVVFHFVAGSVGREAQLLADEGQEAEAVVTGRRVNETVEYDNDNRRRTDTDYYVTYAFVTAAGEPIKIEKSVSSARFNESQEGEKLRIRYVPSSPTVTEFTAGERAGDAGIFGWLSKGMGALAVALAGVSLYLRRRFPAVG